MVAAERALESERGKDLGFRIGFNGSGFKI